MLNTPFSPWPSYSEEEINAVTRVLQSNKVNYWTGTECRAFEKEFAKFTDSEYAITLANGTVALDLALKALDIKDGDEVITTPRTFLASASSIVTAGATPIFADVDLNSQNITAESIERVVTPKTKAVIVVHLAGYPAEMDEIMALSEKLGFYVIEDCAQAHGATYKGRSVGSIGHIGAWSFCQDKIMTTGGEGGMVTTNSELLWNKMWSYKDHGKSYDAIYNRVHPEGFRWLHESFGTNWRMTEMQAAIGRVQLKLMDEWREKRTLNAKKIEQAIQDFDIVRIQAAPDYSKHAYYKYYFFVNTGALKNQWTRDKIVNRLVESGVPCYQGSCSEVYLEKAFDNTALRPSARLKNAQKLGEESIMLLVHPTLTETELEKTILILTSTLIDAQG